MEDVQERNELYELMELVPNHRNALYLYYYEGYSIREISRLMNARENTVKSWMRRGKQELRSLFEVKRMREKKFRGFDDIHCPQSWKEQVMDQAESSERKKASIYGELLFYFCWHCFP